ncbi:hypothetical protein ART_0585 [Arthrobacter sp. PAMC 25486]|nr:hypothetical protein ART_0585 [Arthrobacter sp. PAMC 25486]
MPGGSCNASHGTMNALPEEFNARLPSIELLGRNPERTDGKAMV